MFNLKELKVLDDIKDNIKSLSKEVSDFDSHMDKGIQKNNVNSIFFEINKNLEILNRNTSSIVTALNDVVKTLNSNNTALVSSISQIKVDSAKTKK